jgi:hypothetical protein
MISNLEKYKSDLDKLISFGDDLLLGMEFEFDRENFLKSLRSLSNDEDKLKKYIKSLSSFSNSYQLWYSETVILIKQLLPDRLADFTKLYEVSKNRKKEITPVNYVIEDALHGIEFIPVGIFATEIKPKNAIPKFMQQLNILKSITKRFESSLFEIKQLVQADVFDSELDAAKELNKKGFTRAAGAVAGVVLEGHLQQVCTNHKIKIKKKNPGISYLNDLLKESDVINTPDWRNIGFLTDLRNLCDHREKEEPEKNKISKMIEGVSEVTKTLF